MIRGSSKGHVLSNLRNSEVRTRGYRRPISMYRRMPPGQTYQGGYVLLMCITVLALMFVGATYMGRSVAQSTDMARAERLRVDAEFELESARARVMLLLATVPRSRAGLGLAADAVALDGRTYRVGDSSVEVSFQDTRGLFPINSLPLDGTGNARLERLLSTYGVAPQTASGLVDSLLDYRDQDDLRRLNGAEKEDYRLAGEGALIRNGNLRSVGELARVHGWAKVTALWGADPIMRHVSADRRGIFNPNTADWRTLVAMSHLDAGQAKALVTSRRRGDIADIAGIAYGGAIGDPFGSNAFVNTFPAASVIVTLRHTALPWGYRMLIVSTPELAVAPWRIESIDRVGLQDKRTARDELGTDRGGGDAGNVVEPLNKSTQTKPPPLPELTKLRDLTKPLQVELPF